MIRKTLRAGGISWRVATFSGTYTLMSDVSEFDPNVADATYLAWSHAIAVRALYGDAHDDGAWYGGQRRADLHAGGVKFLMIYQYLVSGQSGAAQAQAFHNLVGAIEPGEVFVADFEEGEHSMLTDWYNEMLSLYGTGIASYLWTYSGLDFGEAQGALPVQWLAAYQNTEPSSPHTLWQFTDDYNVPGVGSADCSVYHGTVTQLAAMAYGNAPAPSSNWTFSPVQNAVIENIGPTSVKVQFDASAGFIGDSPSPAPGIGQYELAMSEGGSLGAQVSKYPRFRSKGTNPESWQVGSLTSGKTYTLGLRASLADGSHSSPWVKLTFTCP
jgi:hypothetical protein